MFSMPNTAFLVTQFTRAGCYFFTALLVKPEKVTIFKAEHRVSRAAVVSVAAAEYYSIMTRT